MLLVMPDFAGLHTINEKRIRNKSGVACFEAACYISCTEIHEREIGFFAGHSFTSVYNITSLLLD